MNRITLVPTIAFIMLFAFSCNSETPKPETDTQIVEVPTKEAKTPEIVESTPNETTEEEVLQPEGTALEGEEDRLKDFTNEKCFSDCYIVDYFLEMDVAYVTVDFVSYKTVKVEEGQGDGGGDELEVLENKLKKLRTFVVNQKYKTCGRVKSKTMEELFEMSKKDPKTIFMIEAEDGIVSELFYRNCAG